MLNRQLRRNIKALDLQIGELSKELEGLKKNTKYDVKMRTLEDLVKLRKDLIEKDDKGTTKSDAVVELERQIEELTMLIRNVDSDEAYVAKMKKLEELTKVRCQLSEALPKSSSAPAIINTVITGVVGISAIYMVLKHEETDIITTKAFSIVTRMLRGI